MIRHIVMLKLKETNDKSEVSLMLKSKLLELKNKISQIRFYEVGINISQSPNAYDVVLVSDFDSMDDLKIYAKHPEHLKVLDLINETTTERKVVDFEK